MNIFTPPYTTVDHFSYWKIRKIETQKRTTPKKQRMKDKYTKRETRRRDNVLKAVKGGIKKQYEDFTSKLTSDNAAKMGEYVSLEYISNNPEIDWDYLSVSKNKDLTLEYVLEHPDKKWNKRLITRKLINEKRWEFLERHIGWDWDWNLLSFYVPISIFANNPDKDWLWTGISRRIDLTEQIILDNPDKPWVTDHFKERFTKNLVMELPHLDWNWYNMDRMSYFHWDLVRAYPEKHWAWKDLGGLDYVPSDVFLDNIDKAWDLDDVSRNIVILESDEERIRQLDNPEIKYALLGDEISEVEDLPAFDIFAGIGGEKREQELILYYTRRHMAAYKIQKEWCKIMYDPYHPCGERIGLRRMFRDFHRIEDDDELERLVAKEVQSRRLQREKEEALGEFDQMQMAVPM